MDEFGRLAISEDNTAPRKGWALLSVGEIDRDQIYETEEAAREARGLEPVFAGMPKSEIVPVRVIGTTIERL